MIDLPPRLILSERYCSARPAIIRHVADPLSSFPVMDGQQRTKGMLPGMIPVIVRSGRAWTPTEITPYAWHDATLSGITKDGSNQVSQWDDLSGNARHATQATPARGPIHSAGSSWLSLEATNRCFTKAGPGWLPTGNAAWTLATIFQFPTTPSSNPTAIALYRNGSGSNNQDVRIGFGKAAGPYDRFYFSHFGNDMTGALSGATNTDYIYIATYNPTSGKTMHVNGTLDASNAYVSQSLPASPGYYSMGIDPGEGGTAWKGVSRVKTFLTVHSALATLDRQKLEGYLAHKWGLAGSLPGGHPYKAAPPTV